MAKLNLVYNPYSGGFRTERLNRLIAALQAESFQVCAIPTDEMQISVVEDADLICVFGGDGTLRDVVQFMGESAGKLPLCIARGGTINLVAREIGYAQNYSKFARQIFEALHRGAQSWLRSQLFRLGSLPIISCLSIGPDSRAVAGVSAELKKRIGRYAYVAAMLKLLWQWPRDMLTIRGQLSSGDEFECQAEAIIGSRGALYAGPFRLSPRASLAQDSIELITLGRTTRIGMMVFSLTAMLGLNVERLDPVTIRTVRSFRFEGGHAPVQVDGDKIPDPANMVAGSGIDLTFVI